MSTQTFRQRDGIAAYVAVQRMAPRRPVERRECTMRHAERTSFERRHGAATPAPLTRRQLVLIGLAWCAVMGATCWLCTDAGMRFLAAIWRLA